MEGFDNEGADVVTEQPKKKGLKGKKKKGGKSAKKYEVPYPQDQRDWATGLFECYEDCGSCCIGLCCPCWLAYQVAYEMGEHGCACLCGPLPLRTKLRTMFGITGSIPMDAVTVCLCCPCAFCQMTREVQAEHK